MTWLKDGINRVLDARAGQDKEEYWAAYNDCLWRIATSGKAELEEFVLKSWEEPFILPTPLALIMCRLYIMESKERTPQVEHAINFILAHCSPGEAEGATAGFTDFTR